MAEASEHVRIALTFAQRYRMRLWAHHLGVGQDSLLDGVASANLWRGARPASARALPFDHRLPAGATQAVLDKAAEAARPFIDPVP